MGSASSCVMTLLAPSGRFTSVICCLYSSPVSTILIKRRHTLTIHLAVLPLFIIPQRQIENLTKASMFASILGFVLVVIICLVMGRGQYHPSNLVEYRSTSGWSPAPSWLLGIGNGEYAFVAAGACVHIAEEIPQPNRRIPLVMSVPEYHTRVNIQLICSQKSYYCHRYTNPYSLNNCYDLRTSRYGRRPAGFSSKLGAILSSHR